MDVISTVLDIALVYYLVYRMMLLIRGTRAVQMLVGIFFVLALFVVSQEEILNLTTVNWVLDKFVSSFIVILIVLFQPDIRRALSEMGKNPLFMAGGRKSGPTMYDEIIRAATRLAAKHIGALIVLEREADLTPFTEEALAVDARVMAGTLYSIFLPSYENPLHDGAVIIRKGRISHAGCFLPLTENPRVDKQLGTRHRAAIGLTEGTDAVVIVVSEESGIISLAEHGELKRGLDAVSLRDELMKLFGPKGQRTELDDADTEEGLV
ncbi:MAG: TIGR00159 family protein [Deltaproteobacteria bacterium]|nr:TIGR00159 family protein [Deltaproteobacteria bacterium]